jgi:hypothetical protein
VYFRVLTVLRVGVTAIFQAAPIHTNTNNPRKGWRKNVEAFEYQRGVCFGAGFVRCGRSRKRAVGERRLD